MPALIVYDWDDTLLPTHYIQEEIGSQNVNMLHCKLSKKVRRKLLDLGDMISDLLDKSQELGVVKIISNGDMEWVYRSCEKFYPQICTRLYPLGRIQVISASNEYEDQTNDAEQYKLRAFLDQIKDFVPRDKKEKLTLTLASIGDSEFEHNAARNAPHIVNSISIKTKIFLLQPCPDITDMQEQIRLLQRHLKDVLRSSHCSEISVLSDLH